MSADRPVSVLVVTALPDERPSTAQLYRLCDQLRSDGARVTIWYLRRLDHQVPPAGTRVVDDLRTSRTLSLLDRVGAGALSLRLRGQILRSWLRTVQPDVVLLDDGLGERVLDPLRTTPPLVVRHNQQPPEFAELEPLPRRVGAITIAAPERAAAFDDVPDLYTELPSSPTAMEGLPFRDPSVRARTRAAYELPTDRTLVTGWGDDGWLDGPDLFVRILWALEARHGIAVDGAWFGLAADANEADRLVAEAQRCGLAGRFWHRPEYQLDGPLSGDAVLLPHRSPTDPDERLAAMVTGAGVVTFESASPPGPGVVRVADLDVEAAATALAE
ncbi:MAG: hypothetical protein ACKOYM_00970, partial [Actinomycetes bacterium]